MRTAILYNFLLEANIMASIAIVLMMSLRRFFRKPLGNTALMVGWLLVAIRLLVPLSLPNPFIYLIRSPYAPDAAIRPIAGQVQVRLSDFFASFITAGPLQGDPIQQTALNLHQGMSNASLPITLSKVYLAGVILVTAWFVFVNTRFRRQLKANRIEAISGKLQEDYQALCRQLKVKPLPVFLVDPLPSACLVGSFRPFIALPLTVSPKDALHVLRHELGHYQNRDHITGLLRLLCCALHWFNPLVWLASHMSYTDAELRCDERVTRAMEAPEKEAYAGVLVLSAARHNAPGLAVLATGMTQTHKKLKARVTGILQGRRPIRWLAVAFVLLASMSLVGAFATQEFVMSPRITGLAPLEKGLNIQTDEEAIAYAQALFGRGEMAVDLQEGLRWEIIKNPRYTADWSVGNVLPQEDLVLQFAAFNKDGRLITIGNYENLWDGQDTATPLSLSDKQRERLAEDLITYLRLMNPEEGVRVDGWITENYRKGDIHFIKYIFGDVDAQWRRGEIPAAEVVVQLTPKVRIVFMTFSPADLDGNG